MQELTRLRRDLLYVTAGLDDPIGVDIRSELEEYYQREVKAGVLYPNLDELDDLGLIDKQPASDSDVSNIYRLTTRGREVIEERREWEDQLVDL